MKASRAMTRLRLGTLCAVAIGLITASGSRAASVQGPCAQITAACQRAGFVRGGAKDGKGLQAHCIDPIMQGTAEPRKASRPLPQVDPQLVASCRLENPRFGQPQAPSSAVDEQPPLASPPPPAATAQSMPAQAPSTAVRRPNIVFILTDDLAWNLVHMPHVLTMQKEGVTFANYFVTDSLCCPSRSSIFTGRYPHNTGIFRDTGKDGGYVAFRDRGHEGSTFATALSAAGYRTAMLGKYLNGYLPAMHRPAPGWTWWEVAGHADPEFNYNLNQDGRSFITATSRRTI
jgi:hypothetical protein